MKFLKRVLWIAIPLILVLGIAAYITVRVAFPPEKVAGIVRTQGSEILGRKVEVGSVRVGVFPRLKLGVSAVTLANDSGFSAEPALTLKRLDLSISWLSLLRFSPVIYEVRLFEPDILFEVNAAGHNNFETLGAPDTLADTATALPELPASVSLEAFVIDNGRIRYRDAQSDRMITLGRLDQTASLSLDPKLTDVRTKGTLEISEISVQDGATGLRKGGVHITVSHDLRVDLPGDSVRIHDVEIGFQDVRAHVEGSLKAFSTDAPVADIHVTAPNISLASLFKEIPPEISPELRKLKVAGTASLEARVRGVVDSNALKAVHADITVRDGNFGHADVPQGIEGFAMDLNVRGDSVRLARVDFHSGPNRFHTEALVTEALNPVPYLRKLKMEGGLDLGNLTALARSLGFLDESIRVSGTQTLKLEASGPLDPVHPERLNANGNATLKNVEVRLPDLPVVRASGSTVFNNASIRQQLAATIGKSDAAVNVVVNNYLALLLPEQAGKTRTSVKVDVRSGLIDLDELLPKTGSDAPADAPPFTAYPAWPPVDADVTVTLARTKLMNLDMTNFSLKTVVREKSAVTDLGGTLYTGGFSSTVSIVPKDTTDWGIGYKLNVNRVEANDFISRLNDRVPLQNKMLKALAGTDNALFGKFNLALDLRTHGLPDAFANNLSGPVVFSITDGRIVGVEWTKSLSASLAKAHSSLGFQEFKFSALKGDLLVDNGKLLVRDLSFDSPRVGAGHAMGAIGFDNSLDLQLTQALPPAASKMAAGAGGALLGQLQKYAPASGLAGASLFPLDKEGRALLYYKVGGTVTAPSFALDVKRMASEGAGNAAANAAQAAKTALEAALRKQQAELAARAQEEKAKLEAAARTRYEAEKKALQDKAAVEKKKLEDKAAVEKQKVQDKAAAEAKKKGQTILKGMGK